MTEIRIIIGLQLI